MREVHWGAQAHFITLAGRREWPHTEAINRRFLTTLLIMSLARKEFDFSGNTEKTQHHIPRDQVNGITDTLAKCDPTLEQTASKIVALSKYLTLVINRSIDHGPEQKTLTNYYKLKQPEALFDLLMHDPMATDTRKRLLGEFQLFVSNNPERPIALQPGTHDPQGLMDARMISVLRPPQGAMDSWSYPVHPANEGHYPDTEA